jgi:hypothetical protein
MENLINLPEGAIDKIRIECEMDAYYGYSIDTDVICQVHEGEEYFVYKKIDSWCLIGNHQWIDINNNIRHVVEQVQEEILPQQEDIPEIVEEVIEEPVIEPVVIEEPVVEDVAVEDIQPVEEEVQPVEEVETVEEVEHVETIETVEENEPIVEETQPIVEETKPTEETETVEEKVEIVEETKTVEEVKEETPAKSSLFGKIKKIFGK